MAVPLVGSILFATVSSQRTSNHNHFPTTIGHHLLLSSLPAPLVKEPHAMVVQKLRSSASTILQLLRGSSCTTTTDSQFFSVGTDAFLQKRDDNHRAGPRRCMKHACLGLSFNAVRGSQQFTKPNGIVDLERRCLFRASLG